MISLRVFIYSSSHSFSSWLGECIDFLTHLQELKERMFVLAVDVNLPKEGEVGGVAVAGAHVLHAVKNFLPIGARLLLETQRRR